MRGKYIRCIFFTSRLLMTIFSVFYNFFCGYLMKSLERCLCLAIFLCVTLKCANSHTKCGDDIIRGVNLGGWLLWEPWIVPTIFEEVNVESLKNKVVDEWTYAQYIDPEISKNNHERYVFIIFYTYWTDHYTYLNQHIWNQVRQNIKYLQLHWSTVY